MKSRNSPITLSQRLTSLRSQRSRSSQTSKRSSHRLHIREENRRREELQPLPFALLLFVVFSICVSFGQGLEIEPELGRNLTVASATTPAEATTATAKPSKGTSQTQRFSKERGRKITNWSGEIHSIEQILKVD